MHLLRNLLLTLTPLQAALRWIHSSKHLFVAPLHLLTSRMASTHVAPTSSRDTLGIGQPLPRAPEHGSCIYLDYQATTPVWPEVAAAAEPYLRLHWGNPSSGHAFGRPCANAVTEARTQVAALINAACVDEIMFTSCGSEADNHAIVGVLMREEMRRRIEPLDAAHPPPHVVTSNIEHPAIERCLEEFKAAGRLTVTYVPVDGEGRVSAPAVAAAVTPHTILVTVMHSNNEVGSVQPLAEIVKLVRAKKPDVVIHTDAAQSIGKLELDVQQLGVDLLTIVGHKFGAPKGVAALYVAKPLKLPNYLYGGGQEGGRRAGTECVVLLAAIGAAAKIAREQASPLQAHMRMTRDRLATKLVEGLPESSCRINGPSDDSLRLPNTLSIGIRGVRSSLLLSRLSEKLAASAGAACHSHAANISAVLRAMEVPTDYAMGTLRLSTGRHTTVAEVDAAAELIIEETKRQWAEQAEAPAKFHS